MDKFEMVLSSVPSDVLPFFSGCRSYSYQIASGSFFPCQKSESDFIYFSIPLNYQVYFLNSSSDLLDFWNNYKLFCTLRLIDYVPVVNQTVVLFSFAQSNGSTEKATFEFSLKSISSTQFRFQISYRHYFNASIIIIMSDDLYYFSDLSSFSEISIFNNNGVYSFLFNNVSIIFQFPGFYHSYNPFLFGYRGLLRFSGSSLISNSAFLDYKSFLLSPIYSVSSSSSDCTDYFKEMLLNEGALGNGLRSTFHYMLACWLSVIFPNLLEEQNINISKLSSFINNTSESGFLDKFLPYQSDGGQILYCSDDWKYFSSLLHQALENI